MDISYSENIVRYTKKYIENLKLPIIPCKNKIPLIEDWPNNWLESANEIKKYQRVNPNVNIGLVLGHTSCIIGVDIDGDEALKKYIELSGGNLQNTWTFKTASGGLRVLFSSPKGMQMKKHTITYAGAHSELAFLGDGQQTIMPPSKIEGGGSYSWVEGKAPWECELAPIPAFIAKLMNKSKVTIENNNLVLSDEFPNEVIAKLSNKCPLFKSDFQEQQKKGLSEDKWFRWISLLTKAACYDVAQIFSNTSSKHNSRSNERLKSMQLKNSCAMIKCTTFGCTLEQIMQCHKSIKNKKDKPTDVINSPGWFIKNAEEKPFNDLKEIGLYISQYGNLEYINGNQFAVHILKKHTLVYSDGGGFYLYEKGIYRLLNENDCSRVLRDLLHKYVPDSWTPNREAIYIETLKRVAPKVIQMNIDKNFIILNDEVMDLSTFQCIPHSKKYLTTIRTPITYDINSECKRFLQFLSEIFDEDGERISVIQEIMGYCLTAETVAQKAFLFYGQGSNGKSVLLKIIAKLVGEENISSVPFEELKNSFARYDLLNKTVNIVTENEVDGKGFNSAYFKAIVAGDPIRLEIKGGKSFTYAPICKILMGINNLLYSKDKSHAFTRRLLIVPFNKSFNSKNDDKFLEEKLEKELPGIFNFAIEGLKRLILNGYEFSNSTDINNVLDDYKKSINPFEGFVEEAIEAGDLLSRVSYGKISQQYTEWREENGYTNSSNISHHALAAALKKILINKNIPHSTGKSNGLRYITGIKIKAAETEIEVILEDDGMGGMSQF
ncbi:MAG: P4 family phage/plasmid primase-like protein [Clostridium sp.]|jgi:P4 family phage/plasmid primase-like protien